MATKFECVPPRFVYGDGVIFGFRVDALEPTCGDGVGNRLATHNPIIRRMKTYRFFIDLFANMGLIGLLFIFLGPIKRTTPT